MAMLPEFIRILCYWALDMLLSRLQRTTYDNVLHDFKVPGKALVERGAKQRQVSHEKEFSFEPALAYSARRVAGFHIAQDPGCALWQRNLGLGFRV